MDKPEESTEVDITEPVSLTFALRYLNSFAKATPLAPHVVLKLSKDLPIVVEYHIPGEGGGRRAGQVRGSCRGERAAAGQGLGSVQRYASGNC